MGMANFISEKNNEFYGQRSFREDRTNLMDRIDARDSVNGEVITRIVMAGHAKEVEMDDRLL